MGGKRNFSLLVIAALVLLTATASLYSTDEFSPPTDYYSQITVSAGEALKSELHATIRNHTFVTYAQVLDAIRLIDQDPANSSNIFLIYSGDSVPYGGSWNREHAWPQSFGADTGNPNSDLHHLFPALPSVNSARSNFAFAELPGGSPVPNASGSKVSSPQRLFEPRDGDKGRIARALLYMDVRYDGSGNESGDFSLSDFPYQYDRRMGHLSDLLIWNRKFAPDLRERRRNHLIMAGGKIGLRTYPKQENRNPFIDYPDLADAIYTAHQYVSTGSWRVAHFSLAQLEDPLISGDLADPDGDGLPNLIELSANLDPLSADSSGIPAFQHASDGTAYITFARLSEYPASGLRYIVEYSEDPLLSHGWQEIAYSDNDVQIAAGEYTDTLSLGDYLLSSSDQLRWLRLKVIRDWPLDNPAEAIFEPFRSLDLRTSSWLGEYADAHYPYIYSVQLGWLRIYSGPDDTINIWHPAIGWLQSSLELFPYTFNTAENTWYFIGNDGNQTWLYNFSTTQWITP